MWIALSFIFGLSVGAAELISRYRDEPATAAFSLPGMLYLVLNGLISTAAYGLLAYYNDKILPGLSNDSLLTSIVAGFGAMVIMRSKLFNLRTEGGENFAIGPDAVLMIFLKSVDRRVDRDRAASRQVLVYNFVKQVKSPDEAINFVRTSLASYQNLSDTEKADLNDIILKVQADKGLTPQLRFMAICFGLLNISGEKNFTALTSQLNEYLRDLQLPDSNNSSLASTTGPGSLPPTS
jgi:hypothetical protein